MNYTEKYHLPQWEETDRVLRTDFNQMCAGMEEGLLETGQSAQEMLEKGLFRAAYNHYQLMSETGSWPRHLGACFRDFAEQNGSGISNSLILEGKRWIANSAQMLTREMLLETMTCTGGFTSADDCVKIRFTAPCAGVFNSIRADGGYQNPNGSTGAYTARLRNLTTGKEESVYKGDLKIKNNTSGAAVYFFVYMVLHARQRYELEIKLDKYDFTPKFNIDPKSAGALVVKPAESGESYTHYNFSDDIPSQGVLALVHYDSWGEGNSITACWPSEEEEYEPTLVRQITDRHGRKVYEAEFRILRKVPGPGKIRFNFRCVPDGEISVYEWGAVSI